MGVEGVAAGAGVSIPQLAIQSKVTMFAVVASPSYCINYVSHKNKTHTIPCVRHEVDTGPKTGDFCLSAFKAIPSAKPFMWKLVLFACK